MKWLKNKIRNLKFRLGVRWVAAEGWSIVNIVERAGTEYIVGTDGSLLRIGGKVKVRK